MFVITILAIVLSAFIALAYYLYIPLPVLSYSQGGREDEGVISSVKSIRPGVIEMGLSKGVEIDPCLKTGNPRILSAGFTSYLHFRKGRARLPRIGDKISVRSINRLHRFTGRSLNWVVEWTHFDGEVPAGARMVIGDPLPAGAEGCIGS